MLNLLVILHFFGFAVGIGGGVANMLAGRMAAGGLDPTAAKSLGQLRGKIGRAGFVGLVVLWVTGIWLVVGYNGGFGPMSLIFWLKMIAVLGLTGAYLMMLKLQREAAKTGTPPSNQTMARLGMFSGLCGSLALILAVVNFH